MGKEWNVRANSELRCEVKDKEYLEVRLLEGNAELFGVELAVDQKYVFNGLENIAIFSWYGCKLETDGSCHTLYVSEETPMSVLANIHSQLEGRRDIALLSGTRGPRVMVVGPAESGRATAARILAMYAARLDHAPILADIDVDLGLVPSVPGSIGAISVDRNCIDIEENFDVASPLVHFFGHTNPGENEGWYKHLVSSLAEAIDHKQKIDCPEARAAGLIVNTGCWSDQSGGTSTELLYHAIEAFEIDIVLVIGHERLHSTLTDWSKRKESSNSDVLEKDATNWRQQKTPPLAVVRLARSGGIVSRSEADRFHCRKMRTNEYFYGKKIPTLPDAPHPLPKFRPHRMDLSISDCAFFRAGGVRLSDSMRPLGSSEEHSNKFNDAKLMPVSPTQELEHSIVAILQDPSSEKKDMASGDESGARVYANPNIAGYIAVLKVEPDLNKITVVSPCPGKLPSTEFLVGSFKCVIE